MLSEYSTDLGPTKHHSIEEDLKLLESGLARAYHPVLLNWGQDLVVPETGLVRDVSVDI